MYASSLSLHACFREAIPDLPSLHWHKQHPVGFHHSCYSRVLGVFICVCERLFGKYLFPILVGEGPWKWRHVCFVHHPVAITWLSSRYSWQSIFIEWMFRENECLDEIHQWLPFEYCMFVFVRFPVTYDFLIRKVLNKMSLFILFIFTRDEKADVVLWFLILLQN